MPLKSARRTASHVPSGEAPGVPWPELGPLLDTPMTTLDTQLHYYVSSKSQLPSFCSQKKKAPPSSKPQQMPYLPSLWPWGHPAPHLGLRFGRDPLCSPAHTQLPFSSVHPSCFPFTVRPGGGGPLHFLPHVLSRLHPSMLATNKHHRQPLSSHPCLGRSWGTTRPLCPAVNARVD